MDVSKSGNRESGIGKFGDLGKRVVTGVVFAGVAGSALMLGGGFWYGFVLVCGLQMLREWYGLTKLWRTPLQLLGMPYILIPCLSLAALYEMDQTRPLLVLWLIVTVAATDIGAYFSGRLIGGPKLAPRLSPNKTWAGLAGGMIAATATLLLLAYAEFGVLSLRSWWIGALTALVAQAGDMTESFLKRRAGVKDAGNFLPGHGGLLDRVDGLLFAAPLWAFLILLMD